MGEKIGGKHEERGPWRMTDLKLVACGDKLGTVPERGCRLNGRHIGKRCDGESHPAENRVY